jgi:hypothetical protein
MADNVIDASVVPYGTAASPVLERTGTDTRWHADADPERYRNPDIMLSDKMPTLVKGAGYARVGGNMPLSDDEQIFRRSMKAEDSFRAAIKKGVNHPDEVLKGLSPDFAGQFRGFMAASPQNQAMQSLVGQLNTVLSGALGKSITLTSPLSSGFVPFDLNGVRAS